MATAAFGDSIEGGQYTSVIRGTDDIICNTKSNDLLPFTLLNGKLRAEHPL